MGIVTVNSVSPHRAKPSGSLPRVQMGSDSAVHSGRHPSLSDL